MLDGILVGCEDMRTEGHPDVDPRTITAHGERLAVVETKVDALGDDTKIIRSNMHGINADLQKIFIMEQRCESSLTQLLSLTKDLPTITATALSFTIMKDEIEVMIDERQQRKGAWKAIVRSGAALVGAATIGGVIASIIFGHIH